MEKSNNSLNEKLHPVSLPKLMLIGAGFASILILTFLLAGGWFTQEPKPEWQSFWMIRPLIVVPLAGAAGGALFLRYGFSPVPGRLENRVGLYPEYCWLLCDILVGIRIWISRHVVGLNLAT